MKKRGLISAGLVGLFALQTSAQAPHWSQVSGVKAPFASRRTRMQAIEASSVFCQVMAQVRTHSRQPMYSFPGRITSFLPGVPVRTGSGALRA